MLSSEIIQHVKRIQFATGRQVADVLAGAYLSVFKGRGMEFDEVRPYVPGDDVRTIDWNVTARTGQPHVKRYVEERELTVVLLVDVSPSLDFGSKQRSKREAAVELSALLAFSAIHNEDKVGLLLFSGSTEAYIPPRKGQKHALRVVREVLARGTGPSMKASFIPKDLPRTLRAFWHRLARRRRDPVPRATHIAGALEFCRRVLPRRAVVFLISDFIDEGYLSVLRSSNRRHDLVSVLITDERETSFEDVGMMTLEDAETGQTRLVDTGSRGFREAVKRTSEERMERVQSELRASGVDLIRVDATEPVVDPLLRFFRMRQKRNRR